MRGGGSFQGVIAPFSSFQSPYEKWHLCGGFNPQNKSVSGETDMNWGNSPRNHKNAITGMSTPTPFGGRSCAS